MGTGVQWTTSAAPRYHVGVSTEGSSFQSSHPVGWVSANNMALGTSFDQYMQKIAQRSGIGELMGGQSLLKNHTSPEELDQLWKLANEQLDITCHFDTKFSNTAFTLLQKTQQAFMGVGGIAKEFVYDMATAGLNFIRDATVYKMELCSSDAITFAEGLKNIQLHIADLICKVEALDVTYEGVQKDFNGILVQVGIEVKEYLDRQTTADCTVFMNKSFESLCGFSDVFNISPFVPVIIGMAINYHLLLMSLQVNVSHIQMEIYLSPLTSDATAASGQMTLLHHVAQQSVAVWKKQSPKGKLDPIFESEDGSVLDKAWHNIL